MSLPTMFEVYDYTNDRHLGYFHDYDEAQVCCDEYVSDYCEPVEVGVDPLEIEDFN